MKPIFKNGNVKAFCPDCETITTFEFKIGGLEYGQVLVEGVHNYGGKEYPQILYKLLRCAGCGRGGVAKLHMGNNYIAGVLEDFFPFSAEKAPIPDNVPENIKNEYRESEICASVKAWRAASAMLRSTLEKILKHNGYVRGNLKSKINAACKEGIITKTRQRRVDDEIRVLGNDILHDEWREVTQDEYEIAHTYAQRILEDFYDDRETVEKQLTEKGRKFEEEEAKEDNTE